MFFIVISPIKTLVTSFPCTALTYWFHYWDKVFTARYNLNI